jgi:hypothetical protein
MPVHLRGVIAETSATRKALWAIKTLFNRVALLG